MKIQKNKDRTIDRRASLMTKVKGKYHTASPSTFMNFNILDQYSPTLKDTTWSLARMSPDTYLTYPKLIPIHNSYTLPGHK